VERGAGDLRALKAEHAEIRGRYDEKLREASKLYKALDEKYRNRESRPEDVQRISELEREMVEKDELVAKTREEMLYFKREMLNREENYNQKFNRQPNVGVMQVLKTKDMTGSDSGGDRSAGKETNPASFGSRKPSPMRMIPATNNSNSSNLGLGIGIAGKK
jgi:predicted nuclease with TOPRIM domain